MRVVVNPLKMAAILKNKKTGDTNIRACEKKLIVDDEGTTLLGLIDNAIEKRASKGHNFISTSSFILVYHGSIMLVLLLLLFCRLHWLEYKCMKVLSQL